MMLIGRSHSSRLGLTTTSVAKMQITQLLFAMGMALTATAAPIPGLTGFPEHSSMFGP
jgi:hypothetical protein